MTDLMERFVQDCRGATAIEYGLIGALFSLAAIPTYQAMGGSLKGIFSAVSSHLAKAALGM
ncbi:MAG: Flp family type IVb pilin [Alphaproteobacteria bacterium]|nr:Flp family type IVb pilin [Alphaproteobacteria bacterium]